LPGLRMCRLPRSVCRSCLCAPPSLPVVSQWCHSGVTVVLQWCYSGVILVLYWCYSGVILVLYW
jgi:hypothetical protein